MSVKHDAVDQRAVYPGPIATPPGLGRIRQELEQWCEHGDVEIKQRVREQVMAHGVAHTPVPVNTVSSNKPGTACALTWTVFSQQVLLGRRTTQVITRLTADHCQRIHALPLPVQSSS